MTVRPNVVDRRAGLRGPGTGRAHDDRGGLSRPCPLVRIVDRVEGGRRSPRRSRRPGSSSPAGVASVGPDGFKVVERARRSARRRGGGDPGGGRFGLDPVRPADRPDRQDRQARGCTSRSGSQARSSTRSGCRRPARSWPSTATPTPPIAEFADLVVIGDLFAVAPALLAALRARAG